MRLMYFILGVIVGLIAIPFLNGMRDGYNEAIETHNNPYHLRGLRMLNTEGECITANNLKVFQVISDGIALAYPVNKFAEALLLIDNNGKLFYDDEVVKNPAKHCAKQIGVYTYPTKNETIKTVPAVVIELEKSK